jgi:hypothetical protein
VSDQPFVEIGEHVEAFGRKIREEVLEVFFLMRVDAETNNDFTRLLVHVGGSHRAQLERVLNGVHLGAPVIAAGSEFPHRMTFSFMST